MARGAKGSSPKTLETPAHLFGGLDVEVKREVALEKYTSLRIGGPAEILVLPRTVEALRELLVRARRAGLPVFLLGQGSNVLAPDEGIRGIVISLRRGFDQIELHPGERRSTGTCRPGPASSCRNWCGFLWSGAWRAWSLLTGSRARWVGR
ncbi:MAG: FAD-binding protein [Candidatus Tectomicrobia bacterium]|uniref:FAD-binding protein n=1 Tax=Tectimicrobiota bacterium TaxID=2528274 RepID=A0A932GP42_UNCTE|nr:FAD-binding protein [Candidatus Tectomicrobia bacterium]